MEVGDKIIFEGGVGAALLLPMAFFKFSSWNFDSKGCVLVVAN
jgi:hypothetical protein